MAICEMFVPVVGHVVEFVYGGKPRFGKVTKVAKSTNGWYLILEHDGVARTFTLSKVSEYTINKYNAVGGC